MDSSENSRWLTGISEECFKIAPVNNKIVEKLQLNRAKQRNKDSFFPPLHPFKVKITSKNMEWHQNCTSLCGDWKYIGANPLQAFRLNFCLLE